MKSVENKPFRGEGVAGNTPSTQQNKKCSLVKDACPSAVCGVMVVTFNVPQILVEYVLIQGIVLGAKRNKAKAGD